MRTHKLMMFFITGALLFQCHCTGNRSNESVEAIDTLSFDSLPDINYLLPAPDEILTDVLSNKIKINVDLVNPKENAVKYLESKSQALNLGVYIADFAYLNLYENKANSVAYLNLIKDLAQKLSIYGYFDESFFVRLQANLMNNDSLTKFGKEMYNHISTFLENSHRENIFALVSTGAMIESLYLSSMSIISYKEYQAAAAKLLEKKYLLKDFYMYAQQYKKDPNVNDVLIQMDNLYKMVESMEVNTSKKTVSKDKANHMVFGGGDKIVMNDRVFYNFREQVKNTRQGIINISNDK